MGRVDTATLLYFDASCLIAAAASPTGGSAFVWNLCERGLLRAAVSQAVLAEAETNLARKFEPQCLLRHQIQVQTCAPIVAPVPRIDAHATAYPGVNRKDEHVVAAALEVRADFLLTLDQPLAEEIERSAVDIQVRSPGAFIRLDLVTHPLFDLLRDG